MATKWHSRSYFGQNTLTNWHLYRLAGSKDDMIKYI